MNSDVLERMRKARSNLRTVPVSDSVATLLVGPSSARISLTFYGAAEAYALGLTSSVTMGAGVVVPQGSNVPVLWTVEYHGDLVQQGVYAIAANDTTVSFIETILPTV